jgi:hypothetical protein
MHAHEMRAYEVHAYEIHAHEMHAYEMHAYEMHAVKRFVCEVPRTRIRLSPELALEFAPPIHSVKSIIALKERTGFV